MLDRKLQRLRDALDLRPQNEVEEVVELINSIAVLRNDDSLVPLLRLFTDDASDSIMFALLHAVESWEDSTYSTALLEVVDDLWLQAPRWTMIIHIRVLNNPKTFIDYSAKAINCPTKRTVILQIYKRIASEWPQMENKVNDALERLHT